MENAEILFATLLAYVDLEEQLCNFVFGIYTVHLQQRKQEVQ